MPRYFFHVIDGRNIIDNEGSELAGLKEARVEAIHLAGSILRDEGDEFWNGEEWRMNVTDASGQSVLKLRFSADDKVPRLKRTRTSRFRLSPFSASPVIRELSELQASTMRNSGRGGRDENRMFNRTHIQQP